MYSNSSSCTVPVLHVKYPFFMYSTRSSYKVPVLHHSTRSSCTISVLHVKYPFFMYSTRSSCTVPGLHVKYPLFSSDLMKLEFLDRFSQNTQIPLFMKNRPVGAELFRVDGRTLMTKLIVAFRNFVNAPKNQISPHLSTFSNTKTKLSILFRETIAVLREGRTRQKRSVTSTKFRDLVYKNRYSWNAIKLVLSSSNSVTYQGTLFGRGFNKFIWGQRTDNGDLGAVVPRSPSQGFWRQL